MSSQFAMRLYGSAEFQPLWSWRPDADGPLMLVARPLCGPLPEHVDLLFRMRDTEGKILWETGVRHFQHPDGYTALIGEAVLTEEQVQPPSRGPVVVELIGAAGTLAAVPLRTGAPAPLRTALAPERPAEPEESDNTNQVIRDLVQNADSLLADCRSQREELARRRTDLDKIRSETKLLRSALPTPPPAEPGPLLGRFLAGDSVWLEALEGAVRRMDKELLGIKRLLDSLGPLGQGRQHLLKLLCRVEETRAFYHLQGFGWLENLDKLLRPAGHPGEIPRGAC